MLTPSYACSAYLKILFHCFFGRGFTTFNLILKETAGFQVDPEVPVSVRRSLDDSNFRRNQDRPGYNSSREPDGFESSEKVISHILKASSISRCQESQIRLERPNPVRVLSRPASANGHVPSIVMLTSVDHSDATKYTPNPIFNL